MSSINHKKRKRQPAVDTSKPTAVYKPGPKPGYTISVALPGSIIANAQTHDQRTALAGQIGRALAVFCVDEVVVFDDGQGPSPSRSQWVGDGRYGAPQHQQRSGMNGSHHHLNSHNSNGYHYNGNNGAYVDNGEEDDSAYTGTSNPSRFLARILSFLETPPHLRRVLFPLHPDLRNAGTLPSLAMPHHLKADEWCSYREGVVVDPRTVDGNEVFAGAKKAPTHDDNSHQKDQEDVNMSLDLASGQEPKKRLKDKTSKKANTNKSVSSTESTTSHLVNVGYPSPVTIQLPRSIPPSTRLTIHFITDPPSNPNQPNNHTHNLTNTTAIPVPPTEPRNTGGYYWGYTVRQASNLSAIFTECPYAGGYDVSFGTSERGVPINSLATSSYSSSFSATTPTHHSIPESNPDSKDGSTTPRDISPLTSPFRHVLLVFGGVAGLEKALEGDEVLSGRNGGVGGGGDGDHHNNSGRGGGRHDDSRSKVDRTGSPTIKDVSELFDFWVNLVPGQGSRTIRTEEAVWLGLMGFNNLMDRIAERRGQ